MENKGSSDTQWRNQRWVVHGNAAKYGHSQEGNPEVPSLVLTAAHRSLSRSAWGLVHRPGLAPGPCVMSIES